MLTCSMHMAYSQGVHSSRDTHSEWIDNLIAAYNIPFSSDLLLWQQAYNVSSFQVSSSRQKNSALQLRHN